MKRRKYSVIISLALCFIAVNCSFAQVFDKKPDERLLSIPKSLRDSTRTNPETYLPILTRELTSNITDGYRKVKIIHDWITTEISYDNEIYLRRSEYTRDTYDVLKRNRAICVGYCNLFNEMCGYANIESAAITGVTKTVLENESTIPKNFPGSNHQWSAAKINGKWYLLDITWDAGYTYNRAFTFRYSTTYLFLDPETFILNHFPEEEKWQLLKKPVTWSEFRELKFVEPAKKLFLNNSTIKGGINFSRLYNLNIPDVTESKGFDVSFSISKGITYDLALEAEVSFEHTNINQDLSLLSPSPFFNGRSNTYVDPATPEPVALGNFDLERIGVGVNLKYHLRNESSLLPFLKTGLSVSVPLSFSSSQSGMIVRNGGEYEVLRVRNFSLFDQFLYGATISTGVDLVKREGTKNNYLPVMGLEMRWTLMLNSLDLFENYEEGENKFKSYSINLMFYL